MIKVAIAGGTGYTAGELIRILINHPQVEITSVLSSSLSGELVSLIHRDLIGDTNLRFVSDFSTVEEKNNLDVIFLTMGHGLSKSYLDQLNLPERCRIIDLGNDFRLGDNYKGREFVYGLTELSKEKIKTAGAIANPGCFATSILLSLIPLRRLGYLNHEIHIHAITGSTGAGKSLSDTTHFSYRESNISVYKPFTHQHLGEIEKTLGDCYSGTVPPINFIPMRGDFTRGIFASVYTKLDKNLEIKKVESLFKEFYNDSPFVMMSNVPLSLKEVVNTNKALIHIENHNGYIHITTIIDNLLKGASGQAVQNMNIMFGLKEECGLKLKGVAF